MTPREQLQAAYELAFYPPRLHAVWKRIKDRRGQPDPALLALVEQALQLQAALPETGYASQRALRRLAVYQANARAFGTVGCLRLPSNGKGARQPADESAVASEAEMSNHYKRSKWQAEQVARELADQGAPVVIVNPSAPVGPRDVKPTPTGQIIVDFLNRALPAYMDTGLNWVHVADVANGHILAAEKGRVGERYILGHAEGNWTMQQTLAVMGELTGLPVPRFRVPHALALGAAYAGEVMAAVTGKPPRAPLAGVRMARYKMWFDPDKAIRELGLPQTPPRQAFAEAIEWFRTHGYVKR